MAVEINRESLMESMSTHIGESQGGGESNSSSESLPPDSGDGSGTEETPLDGGEGDGAGSGEVETGDGLDEDGAPASDDEESDDDQGTTAEDGEGEDPDAEEKAPDENEDNKPRWEEEEAKFLKDHGLDKLSHSEETAKLAKIARDNHAAVQTANQEKARLNDYIAELGNAVVSHDVATLNQIAQELGAEPLPFDLRTETDQVKEIVDSYNEVYNALKSGLTPEEFERVRSVLYPVQEARAKQVRDLEGKMKQRDAVEQDRKKRGEGPVKGQYNTKLQEKADKNFTELKARDPDAQKHFDALKPLLQKNSVFQRASKAYALDPDSMNELGKAVHFTQNFEKEFLPKLKESWEKERKLRKGLQDPPVGGKKAGADPGGTTRKQSGKYGNYNQFAAQRLMNRGR